MNDWKNVEESTPFFLLNSMGERDLTFKLSKRAMGGREGQDLKWDKGGVRCITGWHWVTKINGFLKIFFSSNSMGERIYSTAGTRGNRLTNF